MGTEKLNLAVLISGSGSNLQALIDACSHSNFPARIACVISNAPEAYGLERARQNNIPAITVDHTHQPNRNSFEDALQKELSRFPIDLICLAGFMRILTASFIQKWPDKIINTHPSLLPKFGGKGMFGEHVHRAVLEADEQESGCSIHKVIAEVDQGPIILQRRVAVLPNDTIKTLSARVLTEEHKAYPEAVRLIAQTQHEKP